MKEVKTMREEMRNLISLFEGRIPGVDYTDTPKGDRVTAHLRGRDSEKYTKLGTKIERIQTLKKELTDLEAEVKASTKSDIADLFDAADVVKTRVVETLSLIFTLSKDPEASNNPKYKEILETLSADFTPDLIKKMEKLKETMVTVVNRSPSLRTTHLKEGMVGGFFKKLKSYFQAWGIQYDEKLDALKAQAGIA